MSQFGAFRPSQIVLLNEPQGKVALLNELAGRVCALVEADVKEVVAALLRREELGSTGLGGGIAIPHARLPGLPKLVSILALLRSPIEFEAIDGKPVDIVCVLVAPDNGEALKALASLSRVLRDPGTLSDLRRAPSALMAYEILDR